MPVCDNNAQTTVLPFNSSCTIRIVDSDQNITGTKEN